MYTCVTTDQVVCVRGCLARQIAGVEFGESPLDVVGVEHDASHQSFVGVDLDDLDYFGVERVIPLDPMPGFETGSG